MPGCASSNCSRGTDGIASGCSPLSTLRLFSNGLLRPATAPPDPSEWFGITNPGLAICAPLVVPSVACTQRKAAGAKEGPVKSPDKRLRAALHATIPLRPPPDRLVSPRPGPTSGHGALVVAGSSVPQIQP